MITPCFGYKVSGRELSNVMYENWARWSEALGDAGLVPCERHMGKSRVAVQLSARTDDQLEHAEQEHWISTAGFIALLANWQQSRRQKEVQTKCLSFLHGWFAATIDPESALRWAKELPSSEHHAGLCEHGKARGLWHCDCMSFFSRMIATSLAPTKILRTNALPRQSAPGRGTR